MRQQLVQPGARPAAELHQLRAGLRAAAARSAPMRSTCSPATAARRSASCATTSTPSSTSFSTPLAQAQLGAALAMMGDKAARREGASRPRSRPSASKDDGITRRDYGTGVRDGAALITLASETGIAKAEVPRLVDVVAKAYARQDLHLDAGAGLDAAGRARARRGGRQRRRSPSTAQPHKGQLIRAAHAGRAEGRRAHHRQRRATRRSMRSCR